MPTDARSRGQINDAALNAELNLGLFALNFLPGGEGAVQGDTPVETPAEVPADVPDAAEAPLLLSAGRPQSLEVNALERHEEAFAREILSLRGGEFLGPPRRRFPGIDGWLDGAEVSLKETVSRSPVAVLRRASQAESEAREAGYTSVEVFIRAENVNSQVWLDFTRSGPLSQIPTQGTINAINVRAAAGWIRLISGGIMSAP